MYRAYLSSLITYGQSSKYGDLQCSGYYQDTAKFFDTCNTPNDGFGIRRDLFLVPGTQKYIDGEITFAGKIFHDLNGIDTGLPPGVAIRIEFTQTSNEFRILTTDAKAYKIEIAHIQLQVPVAMLR